MTAGGRDVVVIGGGHNGLVTAALLAKGGLKVTVLEAREALGGGAVTEEFHPGFRVSALAHTAALRASLVQELGLPARGLTLLEPEPRLFAPLPDGRSLRLWGNPERTAAEVHRFSPRDALLAATRNGALLLGVDSLGILAPGKVADLVILTRDPLGDIRHTLAIDRVMSRGSLFSADSLRKAW